jgi:hypothetical protein
MARVTDNSLDGSHAAETLRLPGLADRRRARLPSR